MPKMSKSNILTMATEGFEQSDVEQPLAGRREAAALFHVSPPLKRKSKTSLRGWKDKDWGSEVPVDSELSDVSEKFYDALVLPGGQMNRDTLRGTPEAMALIKAFLES